MTYVIVGYLVASLAFAAPYVIRYLRIRKHEQVMGDMGATPPKALLIINAIL